MTYRINDMENDLKILNNPALTPTSENSNGPTGSICLSDVRGLLFRRAGWVEVSTLLAEKGHTSTAYMLPGASKADFVEISFKPNATLTFTFENDLLVLATWVIDIPDVPEHLAAETFEHLLASIHGKQMTFKEGPPPPNPNLSEAARMTTYREGHGGRSFVVELRPYIPAFSAASGLGFH